MLDLYHRTTPEAAKLIDSTGRMISRENTAEAYFSTRPDGAITGYGDALIHVRVPEAMAELEDEFPDGERHYRIKVADLTPDHFVADAATPTDPSAQAQAPNFWQSTKPGHQVLAEARAAAPPTRASAPRTAEAPMEVDHGL